jgi:hypothetical protein
MTAIRRPGAASAAVLIGLSAGLAIAHLSAPEWSRRAGLDVWNITEAQRAHRSAVERRAELGAYEERTVRRRETANQLAAQLVADTTTLPVATDEIRALFIDDEGALVTLQTTYPDAPTERLRFARHTIERTLRLLDDDSAQRAAVCARLEAQYREMAAAPESPAAP